MSETESTNSKYIRIAIFAVCLIAVIFFVAKYAGAFVNVILVMLGFGAVVLVHEFGHFIIAKLSNIKVEAFSIFMPPVLFGVKRTEKGFKFRILPEVFPKEGDETGEGSLGFTIPKKCKPGETEYRVGLIPFGGFVKMLGQDDVGGVKTSNDPRSFANKSVYTRGAVIAAGVTFNVISAVIIFMVAFLHGINLPPAVVGGVMPDSPAARAGIRAGDEIVAIDGKTKNLDYSNIGIAAALSGRDQEIPITVKHPNEQEQEYHLKAELMPGQQVRLFGILPADSLTVAKLSNQEDVNDLYARTGLRPGDRITAVNGQDVRGNWELMDIIQNSLTPQVTLTAVNKEKDGQTKTIESKIHLEWVPSFNENFSNSNSLCNIYSMVPRLKVVSLTKELQDYFDQAQNSSDSNDTSALKKGDIILAIDNVNTPTRRDMNDIATEYENKEVSIRVLRTENDGSETIHTVTVVPRRSGNGSVLIGIAVALDADHPVVADTVYTADGYEKLDIPRGAAITSVDGTEVSSFYDVVREIKKYPGQRITLDWRINEKQAGNVAFVVSEDASKFIKVESVPIENIPFKELRKLYKADGPIEAITMGYSKSISYITQTYVTLRGLFTGLVSPKNLIGPVGIMRFSYQIVSEQPIIYYVYFLGLISAVIAVFNFLPMPPLDGGLVLLLIIEKIKGSPISEKTQTIIAYITWVLILTLIVYVTFNDLTRKI
jgi:regulator of sigma E protease